MYSVNTTCIRDRHESIQLISPAFKTRLFELLTLDIVTFFELSTASKALTANLYHIFQTGLIYQSEEHSRYKRSVSMLSIRHNWEISNWNQEISLEFPFNYIFLLYMHPLDMSNRAFWLVPLLIIHDPNAGPSRAPGITDTKHGFKWI